MCGQVKARAGGHVRHVGGCGSCGEAAAHRGPRQARYAIVLWSCSAARSQMHAVKTRFLPFGVMPVAVWQLFVRPPPPPFPHLLRSVVGCRSRTTAVCRRPDLRWAHNLLDVCYCVLPGFIVHVTGRVWGPGGGRRVASSVVGVAFHCLRGTKSGGGPNQGKLTSRTFRTPGRCGRQGPRRGARSRRRWGRACWKPQPAADRSRAPRAMTSVSQSQNLVVSRRRFAQLYKQRKAECANSNFRQTVRKGAGFAYCGP